VITGSATMESKLATGIWSGHISNQQTTSHSGLAGSMDQVDKAIVISQLIEKANWLSGKQGGELQISLKPEFLGRVNLQASMVEHALVATLTVESSVVKTLLESQIGTLQQSLQDQGLPVSKIVVVQGNDTSFASFGSGQAHAEQHLPQSQPARMPFVPEFQPAEPEPGGTDIPPLFHQASIRSLNLIV
jgi:flagellar hook-length control protein FliK